MGRLVTLLLQRVILSNNLLWGPICKEIGNLRGLQVLNLNLIFFCRIIPLDLVINFNVDIFLLKRDSFLGHWLLRLESLTKWTFVITISLAESHHSNKFCLVPSQDNFLMQSHLWRLISIVIFFLQLVMMCF